MDDFGHPAELCSSDDHRRTIIHIDIDCFYAQVEMIKDPNLRELPLGIQQKNIVVTCNYIAREYGIKKCMYVTEAKDLCPQLVLVCGEDLHDYKQMSSKITSLLKSFSPQVEKLGLDENFVDVSHIVAERNDEKERNSVVGNVYKDIKPNCGCGCHERLCVGSHIAGEIRNRIRNELGLTCCAGISYNKLLSKLVCSTHKPDQQTTLFAAGSLDLITNLPSLRCIPGIGARLSKILQSHDIYSVAALQNSSIEILRSAVGVDNALRLKKLSFGIDNLPIKPSGKPLTIGVEDGCKKVSLESEVRERFSLLLQKLMILLSEDGRIPCAVKLTVRKYDNVKKASHRESKQCNIPPVCFSSNDLGQLSSTATEKLMSSIMQLFHKLVDISKPFHLTLLGLAFSKFQERRTGKNSIASFLRKDLSVQTITSFKHLSAAAEEAMELSPSTHTLVNKSLLLNGEKSGSESEPEPSPKKLRIESWLSRRKRAVCIDDDSDDASPSKLRVSDIQLNSSDSVEETSSEELAHNQMDAEVSCNSVLTPFPSSMEVSCLAHTKCESFLDYKCPSNVDESVFRELPVNMQKELIESWNNVTEGHLLRSNLKEPENLKSNKKTLLHYFISNK